MKQTLYFIALGIVVIAGIAGSVYFGIQPRSVPKIDYSEFAAAGRIGEAMAMGLRNEFEAAPVLLLGVWPGHEEDFVAYKSLLEHLNEPGLKYDVIVREPGLPHGEIIPATAEISFRDDFGRIEEGIRNALNEHKRIVIITASPFASRLVKENQANQLFADKIEVMSIAASPFPRNRDGESALEVQCMTANDDTGVGSFGCAVLNKARSIYRKKKDPAKFSATLDMVGAMDYLLLLNPPVADTPKVN